MANWKKLVAMTLLLAMVMPMVSTATMARTPQNLYVTQVQQVALATHKEFTKQYNEIILAKVKYDDAVRSVKEKMRDMSTFRWTPLLSFKFPERANLSEAMEFTMKPLQYQVTITNLSHELADLKYEILGKVTQLFTDCYVLQEQISFEEDMMAQAKIDLERVKFSALADPTFEPEVKRLEKKITTLVSSIAQKRRNFEVKKETLGEEVGMNLTTGYVFQNSLEQLNISRSQLEGLVNHTLANDQSYYEAKMATQSAKLNLDMAESMMKNHYGGYVNMLTPYLTQIRQGKEIDTAAFQLTFMDFLQKIDARWQGSFKILFFIKIPKEWIKGSLDGIRYVQDEPMYLFTAALEYQAAYKEQLSLETQIRKDVELEFENIITAHNGYKTAIADTGTMKSELSRMALLNQQGTVTGEEVNSKQEDYQAQQQDTLGLLSDYNELLIAYDRLTCGGITALLSGTGLDTDVGDSGDMLASVASFDGPYYYSEGIVEDQMFEFGVNIPEDFEPAITHFELWNNGSQVGARTQVGQNIRHLALANTNDETTLEVLLYNEGKLVATCEISALESRGPLEIEEEVAPVKETEKVIGVFKATPNKELGLLSVDVTIRSGDPITGWRLLTANGMPLADGKILATTESLTYLELLAKNLADVQLELYDAQDQILYVGRLEPMTMEIYVPVSEGG